MKISLFASAVAAFSIASLTADEITIKAEPFELKTEITATFLPAESIPIQIAPKSWENFIIEQVVAHGTKVEKGQTLLSFEKEDYHQQVRAQEITLAKAKLQRASAEQKLATLKLTNPRKINDFQVKVTRSLQELKKFEREDHAVGKAQAEHQLKKAQNRLAYAQEELDQLLKMYEADGTTEETEEIILERQRARVEEAQLEVRVAKSASKWALNRALLRKEEDLKRSFEKHQENLQIEKVQLGAALTTAELELQEAQQKEALEQQRLADLRDDEKLFIISAPSSGTLIYGAIQNGKLSNDHSTKFLKPKGKTPLHETVMIVIPKQTRLQLEARLDQKKRFTIPAKAPGTATIAGLPGRSFAVKVTSLKEQPEIDGTFRLTAQIDLSDTPGVVAMMTAKITFVTHRAEAAILLPKKVILSKNGESAVQLKMANGKIQTRRIKTGHSTKDRVEILSGLTVDQVVLAP